MRLTLCLLPSIYLTLLPPSSNDFDTQTQCINIVPVYDIFNVPVPTFHLPYRYFMRRGVIIVVEEGEDQGDTYNQGATEHSGSDISQTNTDQKSIQINTKSGVSESNPLPLSPASKRHLSEIMRHRYAFFFFSFSLLLLSYYDSDDGHDDDGDDEYTNTFSASCSFYIYILLTFHLLSPSPSFLISLYIIIIIFFYPSRSHINKDRELPSLFTVLSFDEFLLDFRKLRNAVHSGPVSSYSYKHLELLSAKYSLHTLLNSTRELDAQKSVCHSFQ